MIDLVIEVPDDLYEAIRVIGDRNGRSADDEARAALIAHYSSALPLVAKPAAKG
jgi:plasmid stability protein